ncbi:MAG: sortase family protein [Bryobacterales bacterium]|nr:sortase family protein [Bryobacterales bacterium]
MWRTIQWGLCTLGLLNVGYWVHLSLKARGSQIEGARELERTEISSTSPLVIGDVVGRLEIPRLSISTVVFEGADQDVLERGAGHLPGSALPGDRGNTVLAAHRDTFFRPLRRIRVGDVLKIHTPRRDSIYIVESARVVEPDEVDVIKPTTGPAVTLITCYPFRYIGPAPERFVVRAVPALHPVPAP